MYSSQSFTYCTKSKCRQGYYIVDVFIPDCHSLLSYTGHPYLSIHVVSLDTEKKQVASVPTAISYHHWSQPYRNSTLTARAHIISPWSQGERVCNYWKLKPGKSPACTKISFQQPCSDSFHHMIIDWNNDTVAICVSCTMCCSELSDKKKWKQWPPPRTIYLDWRLT